MDVKLVDVTSPTKVGAVKELLVPTPLFIRMAFFAMPPIPEAINVLLAAFRLAVRFV